MMKEKLTCVFDSLWRFIIRDHIPIDGEALCEMNSGEQEQEKVEFALSPRWFLAFGLATMDETTTFLVGDGIDNQLAEESGVDKLKPQESNKSHRWKIEEERAPMTFVFRCKSDKRANTSDGEFSSLLKKAFPVEEDPSEELTHCEEGGNQQKDLKSS